MTNDQLVERFAEIGIAQDEALFHDQYAKFNRLYDQMDRTERQLRARGPDARRSLMRLYDHPNLQVRLNAAKRTLAVAPFDARRIIQEIADSKLYPQAGDAGICLSNLDDGTFKPK
ncbi:MAG: DUF2019 domain-containing protein [Beijerinckiaceae bacterium]